MIVSIEVDIVVVSTLFCTLMNDEELWNVLDFWSYWESPPPAAVPREVCLPDRLDSELVLAIQGVRRCGKSTLLGQLVGKYRLDLQR